MDKKFLQLVLMPEDGGAVRSYRIAARSLQGAAVALAVLILLFAASLLFHWKSLADLRELNALKAENAALSGQVGQFGSAIGKIEKALAWSAEAEQEARLLAGLEPIDEDTRRLGIGGPVLQIEPSSAIRSELLRAQLRDEGMRIDQLKRQVSFQNRSYSKVLYALRNRQDQLSRTPTICPVRSGFSVTSRFGRRLDPFTGRPAYHNGLDFRAMAGTPVLATARGSVSFVGRNGDFGICVLLDHGDGIETAYCHLRAALVEVGEPVDRGKVIGEIGSTGRSTGSHLHYEVRVDGRPVNPKRYILSPSVIVD